MEAWRADWDELQKAINGNTIDDALLQSMLRSHRGRSSPTKFVVSEEQMYLASVQSGGVPTLGTPVRKQSPPSQPEPEPEMGPSEGVPPQASALQAPARPLRGLARLAGASVEQDLLSSILSEARPASVAPPPAHDSAEQDLLRRTGLAPAAAAAGVRATRTAGRELGVSGDVVTVAFRKVYDPLAMPGIARPSAAGTERLSQLLEKSQEELTSLASQRRATWAARGWARDSIVASGALSSILGPSPLLATSSYQESPRPAQAATDARSEADSTDAASDRAPSTILDWHARTPVVSDTPQPLAKSTDTDVEDGLDASFRLASRLRAGQGEVSGASAHDVHAGEAESAPRRQVAAAATPSSGYAFNGSSALLTNSRTSQGTDGESDSQSTPGGLTSSAGDAAVTPRGSLSRRPVGNSRLADEVLVATFGTGRDGASPKPSFRDRHTAAREAYTSRRRQLEEDYLGQADPYGAELESTPLARDRIVVEQQQSFRARLPTASVGRQISQVRGAQIVQGANTTPTLLQ